MVRPEASTGALEHEINSERASSLAAAEARARKAVAALGDNQDSLAEARDAVWSYFVQRELIGFRRHNDVIRDLDIPAKVLYGLGVISAKRP
ncbi:hypothetical protein H0482_03135 [Devosia sp. CC-YST696]|nr:hypothetical protein [Devosia faecipullorum]